MTEQELLDLKQEIEQAKENLSKLEGRKEAKMDQLKADYGIKTIAAAQKKIKQLEKEIAEWGEKIRVATKELENKLYGGPDSDPAE